MTIAMLCNAQDATAKSMQFLALHHWEPNLETATEKAMPSWKAVDGVVRQSVAMIFSVALFALAIMGIGVKPFRSRADSPRHRLPPAVNWGEGNEYEH